MFSEGTITCYVGESQVPVGDRIPAEDCNTWLATSYLGMYIALALLSFSLPVPLSTNSIALAQKMELLPALKESAVSQT